ncbi:glycoside hydrolase family 99-like domain-containing protein [Pseudomonas sp. CT11-2]|uniref:glycoside hydrolase family 99-like domain-containing protein n=1 Tax=unclassified Pseudomonas TaxID=196821 RepID=UPI00215ECEB8|nr:glycoside hydrolase family 99-like domain-containing protein [Pseudomonas sp. B21-019]UVM34867.1 glycoside hydrolase family 99-like domain-containing protein [Pseudomonas sp. B21-019]
MKYFTLAISFCLMLFVRGAGATDVGVFYYPGWNKPNIDSWARIKPYSDREPLLGWYKEGTDTYTKTYITWMKKYGVDYVIYDWYWEKNGGVKDTTYAVDSFIKNSNSSSIGFSLLWANHSGTPVSYQQFDEIVNYWITHYFGNERYKKINGKPVVFVFSHDRLSADAKTFGATPKELLERARVAAVKAGYKGIYFIGSASADKKLLDFADLGSTYDALSAYNYHLGFAEKKSSRKLSVSYPDLAAGYAQSWKWIIKNSNIPYILPLTSGWDRSPWGGSVDPSHDKSVSTPEKFYEHLQKAKSILNRYPDKTLNSVVICCWNEYGEGSYIEPTKQHQFKYLEGVRKYLK